jgi:hypothetical protein
MLKWLTSPPRYAVPIVAVVGAAATALLLRLAVQPAWPGQISSPLLLAAVAMSA